MRMLLSLLAVAGLLGVPATAADDPAPPRLDVAAAEAALDAQQVYVAPGSVARLDLAAIRQVLTPDTRLLIAPYAQGYRSQGDQDEHFDVVYTPIQHWRESRHLHLIMVEGLLVSVDGEVDATPGSLTELREQTAYLDVTGPVLGLVAYLKDHAARVPYPSYRVVQPSSTQVDDLAGHLRRAPVYNDPARSTDRIEFDAEDTAALHRYFGDRYRIAGLPVLPAGAPFVDYAPALAKRFPGQIVMVAQGRWLEVVGPDQQVLTSARDYGYGRYENAFFRQGSPMSYRIATVGSRIVTMQLHKPFGRPQPQAQPPAQPFDVRGAVGAAAPWTLLGSALVLSGAGLVLWRRRTASADAAARAALRTESARTVARIGELGARVLAVEERGRPVNPAVAERHATAQSLYEQALTAAAMVEVGKVADEGLALPVEGGAR